MPANTDIPVQAVLKLVVDRMGSQDVERLLKGQDEQFSKIERSAERIGMHMEGVAGVVRNLVGLGSLGAVVSQFAQVETSASNAALAAGRTTGGAGAWHPYGQQFLGVQSRTGVAESQVAEGFTTAVRMVGGTLNPQQAGTLGGMLAGFSQVSGMTPTGVAQILGNVLQATNHGYTPQGTMQTLAGLQQTLTQFPGGQVGQMLPVVAGLAQSQGIAALGTPFSPNPQGAAAMINMAAGTNRLFRSPEVASAAMSGLSGYGATAYRNPFAATLFHEAGIGVEEQMSETWVDNPAKVASFTGAIKANYPSHQQELEFEHSAMPPATVALLQAFNKGGPKALKRAIEAAHRKPNTSQLNYLMQHAQAGTTPEALAHKAQGGIEQWLFESPLHAALGLAGGGAAWRLGGSLLRGLPGLALAPEVLGGAAVIGGVAAGGQTVGKWITGLEGAPGHGSGVGLGLSELGAGTNEFLHDLSHNPLGALKGLGKDIFGGGSTPRPRRPTEGLEGGPGGMAAMAIKQAERKYGPGWWHNSAGGEKANKLIHELLPHVQQLPGMAPGEAARQNKEMSQALGLVNKSIGDQRRYGEIGPQGYWTEKFGEAVDKFIKGIEKEGGSKNAAYSGGGGMRNIGLLGAPAQAGLASMAPGLILASYLHGPGTAPNTPHAPSAGGPTITNAALTSPSGSSAGWDQVLHSYSGNSYGLAHIQKLAHEHPGGGAHPHDRAIVAADAKKYGIPFDVLWGVYGAESSWGKAASNFGLTGQFPGRGTSGNFATDARMSAQDLAHLLSQLHVHVEVGGHKVEQHKALIGAGRTAA